MSPTDQIVRRSIGIVFADGGLLALSAVRPQGAGGHGEEAVGAVLCGPDGAPVDVSETLLSTEYGPDGVQRRATLELWLDDEDGQPLRGAGTLISAGRGQPSRAERDGRLLPLGGRGARGARPLRGRARR